MLIYPQINPIAFSLGSIHVHWYGIMYLLSFFLAWVLAIWRNKHYDLKWTSEQISDLIFFAALGVILGGRLGYMLFYNVHEWLNNPLIILKIWEGGMSFHGGLIGVAISLFYFAHKIKKPFLEIGDFVAPLVPIGLGAGRIGNFINAELWGRETDVPWGMIFPNAGFLPRHPSQLYEFLLEGVLLFIILWIYASKKRPNGSVSGVFLMCYAVFRIFVECFRQPDPQLGFLIFNELTMGQLLSIPMFIIGFILWRMNKNANLLKST